MGCFDTVKAICPSCGAWGTTQTKCGPCDLKTYRLSNGPVRNVPLSILYGVDGESVVCEKCGTTFYIHVDVIAQVRTNHSKYDDDDYEDNEDEEN